MESECDLAGERVVIRLGIEMSSNFILQAWLAACLNYMYIPLFSCSVAVQMLCRSVSRCISCRVSVFGLSHALNHGEPKKEEEEEH